MDIYAVRDVTSVRTPESHTNMSAAVPDLTVSEAHSLDESHSIEVRSDDPVELDCNVSSRKSSRVNKFNRTNYDALDAIAKLEQITEVPFPLRNVNEEHKDMLVTSISEN